MILRVYSINKYQKRKLKKNNYYKYNKYNPNYN